MKINIIKGRYFWAWIISFFDLNANEKIKKGRYIAEVVARIGSFNLTEINKAIKVKDIASNMLK